MIGWIIKRCPRDLAAINFVSCVIFGNRLSQFARSHHAYFRSDWSEKVNDGWYSDELIIGVLHTILQVSFKQQTQGTYKHRQSEKQCL